MPIGEPQGWSAQRKARLAQQWPVEFGHADAAQVMGIDAQSVAQGKPPSTFSQTAVALAAHAAQAVKKP